MRASVRHQSHKNDGFLFIALQLWQRGSKLTFDEQHLHLIHISIFDIIIVIIIIIDKWRINVAKDLFILCSRIAIAIMFIWIALHWRWRTYENVTDHTHHTRHLHNMYCPVYLSRQLARCIIYKSFCDCTQALLAVFFLFRLFLHDARCSE